MKFKDFTEDQQEEFFEQFYSNWPKMYELDTESPLPWGCPWLYSTAEAEGDTIEEMANNYRKNFEAEIRELLEEENMCD